MERKRIWLRCTCEEEEDLDRRTSLRFKKKVKYMSIEDDEEQDDEEDQGDQEDQEDNEQPGTSTQNTYNQRAQEKRLWPVTCGNKKGILHVEKLDGVCVVGALCLAEVCIECEGHWFSPRAFEVFGGKASNKKWKQSISYKNKPLQFWCEQGYLTINGLRRGPKTKKQKKILSHDHISESEPLSEASEIQSAEETEEDDVKDEDWLPGNEELSLETEEGKGERVGTDNGGEDVDSGVNESPEEEDEMEKGETEDEDTADDQDNSVFEERVTKSISPTPEKIVLKKEVKIILQRVPEFQATRDCQSIEHPLEGSLCEPLDEDAQNEKDREHSGSEIDDPGDHTQMSDSPIIGGVEEENVKFTQSNERNKDGQREIKTEPAAAPDLTPEILNETEDTSNHTANLRPSPVLLATQPETRFPHMKEGPSSTFSNLDTMDLQQLKREKIKMQLKVLKLQDEYYTLKIKKLKT